MRTDATHSPHATIPRVIVRQSSALSPPDNHLLITYVVDCNRFLRCFSACIACSLYAASCRNHPQGGLVKVAVFVGGYCVINSLSLYFLITTNSLILGRPRPKRYVMSPSRVELCLPMIAQARRHAYGSHTLTQSIEPCPYTYTWQCLIEAKITLN